MRFRSLLARGELVYLLGLANGPHDSGATLVRVHRESGIELIGSHEEERFSGVKPQGGYPELSIECIKTQIDDLGIRENAIFACLASFDHARVLAQAVGSVFESFPRGLQLLHPSAFPGGVRNFASAFLAPRRLGRQLGMAVPFRVVGMPHHGNHAAVAWAISPFSGYDRPTLIVVVDASGDEGSYSVYVAADAQIRQLHSNQSMWDSLGHFYGFVSSSYGGWVLNKAEGRWMGAAGYGDLDRSTNRYYPAMRRLLHLDDDGEIRINRRLCNWHNAGFRRPFSKRTESMIGRPIPYERIGDTGVGLWFGEGGLGGSAADRVELAAASQMVFEDGLFHIVDHWIRKTGIQQMILTGGTALNCLANMRILERFEGAYLEEALEVSGGHLELWIPPTPGDEGTHAGAVYQFALANGAKPGRPLQHAFYCGRTASEGEILEALASRPRIDHARLGDLSDRGELESVARLLAQMVADGGIVGLHRGRAEIGHRALGNRSILANACDPRMREIINRDVKHREPFRPLAPMCTLRDAERFFELRPGGSTGGHSAYRWMVLAARARPEAMKEIPGVIHRDGTARIQIVTGADALLHAFLRNLGRLLGVETAVNTSLNVGTPLVQHPSQAIDALQRARGLHAILFVGAEGPAHLAWPSDRTYSGPRRPRKSIASLVEEWQSRETPRQILS